MMRLDLFYGFKVQHNPNAFLQYWADRELREGMAWLRDEFRLQARLDALADDDGMPALTVGTGTDDGSHG
jgi:hypothetical protein